MRAALVVEAAARVPPDDAPPRAGFTASKKVGNAVQRNRARRRLKEAVRLLLPLHGARGSDYVFIARKRALTRAWPALLDDVKSALLSLAPPRHTGVKPTCGADPNRAE